MRTTDPVYLTAKQLRARWGNVSHMFVERLLQNDDSFPRPIRLGGGSMRFWRLKDIVRWERRSGSDVCTEEAL